MPINSKYLFVASMDVDPDKEALFNEIYDAEHVPNLLKVAGDARRYTHQALGLTFLVTQIAHHRNLGAEPDQGLTRTEQHVSAV